MVKLSLRRDANEPDDDPSSAGPHLFHDRGLLSGWFLAYRLDEEVQRAQRYGRPLAVMLATPQLLVGENVPDAAMAAAIEAAHATARNTDLVGFSPDGQSILIVMAETSAEDAQVAASRWQSEMWLRGRTVSGPKWEITLTHGADDFPNQEVLAEAIRQRERRDLARARNAWRQDSA